MAFSACSVFDCKKCNHLKKERCPGCAEGNAMMTADGIDMCAIYQCVTSKSIDSCGECAEAVCPFTRDLEMVCPVRAHFEKKRYYTRKMSEHFIERRYKRAEKSLQRKISDKTITRLRWYLFGVNDFIAQNILTVSSNDLSRKVGVRPWLIRRDLSNFGEFGRPSIGYQTEFLRDKLAEILRLDERKRVIWVGASRLSHESSLIKRFENQGFDIVSVFDLDENKNKTDFKINPLSKAGEIIREKKIHAAVIAVPEENAQQVADMLIAGGLKCLLNLTSAIITAPAGIHVRNVDIAAELFALSYYCGKIEE